MSKRHARTLDIRGQGSLPKRTRQAIRVQAEETAKLAAASGMAGFTLRISSIPSFITKDQFLNTMNDLPLCFRSSEGEQRVLGWSFTLPASSADVTSFRAATVTFALVPSGFKSGVTFMSVNLFWGLPPVVVDSHFHGLTPLYHPIYEPPSVDIIAVTGLAGHAFGSWKSRGSYKMWLRDFLPADVPNARILIYGYHSTLFENNSHASIFEFSQNFLEALKLARNNEEEKCRPILFIGHSLGGLVIRHALVTAQSNNNDFILNSYFALLLFGVPHRGMRTENLSAMVRGQPNLRLIEDLRESSNFLRLLDQYWRSTQPQCTRVVSVYETRPTPTVLETPTGWKRIGQEVLMVDRDSATYATPQGSQDDILSIDANHSEIVKFDDSMSEDYLNVRSKIISLVHNLSGISTVLERGMAFGGQDEGQKRNEVLRWISEVEYIKHHENAKEGLLENTGEWLRNKEQFIEWRSSRVSSILWLHGTPGAGKTKLTYDAALFLLSILHELNAPFYNRCMIIDSLKSLVENADSSGSEHESVVYFYCNQNESLRQNPTSILQSIVKQLCLARPDLPGLPKIVVAEYDKRVKDGLASGSLSFEECHKLMVSLLKLYPQTTIVIDGFDECDPQKRWKLLDSLTTIIQSSSPANLIKLFISSRDDIDITLKLENMPNLYIRASDNGGDIARFVVREVTNSIEKGSLLCGRVSRSLKKKVIETIIEKARGMFQWADLQVKYLCQMNDEDDILENLGSLPMDLEGAYILIYAAILSERPHAQSLAKRALMWIMCSQMLLTREEWADLSYWPKQAPDGGFYTLFKLCRNLVTWDSQSNAVRFAHLSVREYLESKINPVDAHSMAAKFCLEILNHGNLKTTGSNNSPRLIESLVRYSAFSWSFHLEFSYNGNKCVASDTLRLLKSFLGTPEEPGRAYCKWPQDINDTRYSHSHRYDDYDELEVIIRDLESIPMNPLFVISYFHFGDELLGHWKSCSTFNINVKNKRGATPLFLAIARRNERVASLLLDGDVDVNSGHNLFFKSPLQVAIETGQASIVVKLLHLGAKMDGNCGYPYTDALEAAARGGQVEVFKAITTRDVETLITGSLIAVVERQSQRWELLEILLGENANVKIANSALVRMIRISDTRVKQLLVSKVPTMDITYNILGLASQFGTLEMDYILKIAPDFNIPEVVMVAAARNIYCGDSMIGLLLEHRPKIEITQAVMMAAAKNVICGKTILKLLAENAHSLYLSEEVLKMILQSQLGCKEVVQLLLAKYPDAQISRTVLEAAANTFSHSRELIEIFLPRSPNTEITEAVMIAAARNASGGQIVSMLLAKNPNTEITKAVLIAAARSWGMISDPMRPLLEASLRAEITEEILIVAILHARRSLRMIEMIIEKSPITAITKEVMAAAVGNRLHHESIAKLLLEKKSSLERCI